MAHSIIRFYLSGRFLTRHTQKNNRENTAALFFCGCGFFFFSKCHTKHKPKTKHTQHQCSSAFSSNNGSVEKLLQKLLLKKTRDGEKKKIRERKKKMPKRLSKNRRLGPRTSVIPHYYYPQDHTITRPHYHKRAWHNREHEERERPHVPLVRTKQKRCFDAEERKRVPKRKT